jgi:ribokinase
MTIEPGGKGANQAVAAARDGAGVILVGAVGADALAQDALRLIRATGIDITRVAIADATTGCATICVDPQGRNLIAVASGANLAARAAQVEDALLSPETTLLLQMEVPPSETEALIARARGACCRIVLNLAPVATLAESALRALDVLVVNEGEAACLADHLGCPATAAALHARLGVTIVVTLGEAGLDAMATTGAIRLNAHTVHAIDTTGAGDCFTGVLASHLDRGGTLAEALARANMAAALCCTRRGTQGSMPFAAETEAALRK